MWIGQVVLKISKNGGSIVFFSDFYIRMQVMSGKFSIFIQENVRGNNLVVYWKRDVCLF